MPPSNPSPTQSIRMVIGRRIEKSGQDIVSSLCQRAHSLDHPPVHQLLQIPGGGSANPPTEETVKTKLHTLKMLGSEVFKVAVRTMDLAVRDVVHNAGLKVSDIHCLIPHQANMRILQAVAERLEMPLEKIFINVEKYGNMSSASTAVALYEAEKTGKIKKGDYVVLVAFGGGLTWASTLIKW